MQINVQYQAAFACFYQEIVPFLTDELKKEFHKHIPQAFLEHVEDHKETIKEALELSLGTQKATSPSPFLYSVFNEITLHKNTPISNEDRYIYLPQALSAKSIFPQKLSLYKESKAENNLWNDFIVALNKIPKAHKENPSLWLDHFDTALQCFTCHLPSKNHNNIALYDQLKTSAALASALAEKSDISEKPFLFIQGDFFGIQDFIFSTGSQTNKQAAKILRGRSFQVSLFTELAALKVLEALNLPSTSQLMNAAGKFLIVAANTIKVKQSIDNIKKEINQWFIKNTYGLAGLGLAYQTVPKEALSKEPIKTLMNALFQQLEITKLQRLDILENDESVQEVSYSFGVCPYNTNFPASSEGKNSLISSDQIKIGEQLAKKARIIVCAKNADIYEDNRTAALGLDIFSYRIIFTKDEEITGKFSQPAKTKQIKRLWDFELPKNKQDLLWHGYARRYINAYIPYLKEEDFPTIKTFDQIAEEDTSLQEKDGTYEKIGQVALMTLKGDVDNLGLLFQRGIKNANFAQITALSRQINQFFSLWLPAHCAEQRKNTYTVFAGGDDFFLIGPWRSTQTLGDEMHKNFKQYVAHNPDIHFSTGMVMTKLGMPVPRMSAMAEEALEQAKKISGKNALTLYQQSFKWQDMEELFELEEKIKHLASAYNISNSYLYSLIYFASQAENFSNKIENTMWRSRFYYRTVRYVIDKLKEEKREQALNEISTHLGKNGIEKHKQKIIVPLFNYFYLNRNKERV